MITNGGYANWYTVYAKTDRDAGHRGMSGFIVPRDAGVVVDKHEDKMGQRASNTAAISFPEVKVPNENMVGEEGRASRSRWVFRPHPPGVAAVHLGLARCGDERRHRLRQGTGPRSGSPSRCSKP